MTTTTLDGYVKRLNDWSGSTLRVGRTYRDGRFQTRLSGRDRHYRRTYIVGTATFCLKMAHRIRAQSTKRSDFA